MESTSTSGKIAWTPQSFADAISKSRAWLYALPPELQPKSVKLGKSRLITERPEDFLRRLAAAPTGFFARRDRVAA